MLVSRVLISFLQILLQNGVPPFHPLLRLSSLGLFTDLLQVH